MGGSSIWKTIREYSAGALAWRYTCATNRGFDVPGVTRLTFSEDELKGRPAVPGGLLTSKPM